VPQVRNAQGLSLGPVLGPSTALLTLPNGRKSYAELYPDGPPADLPMSLFYVGTNCAGDPYVSWSAVNELLPATIVRRAGAWAVQPGTTALRAVKSFRNVSDAGVSPTCVNSAFDAYTSRFDFYTLEQLNLIAPLSVQ
jgi:hypothetical protein